MKIAAPSLALLSLLGVAVCGAEEMSLIRRLYLCGGFRRCPGCRAPYWYCPSDTQFKKDIEPIVEPMNIIHQLEGFTYHWKVEEFPEKGFDDKSEIGFLAQDLEKVLPDTVNTEEDGYKSVEYYQLIPLLAEGLKEAHEQAEQAFILAIVALVLAVLLAIALGTVLAHGKFKQGHPVGTGSKDDEGSTGTAEEDSA